MSENPFHSRWYRAWSAVTYPLRLLGFYPALQRCGWTRCHARVTLFFGGWA